MLITSVATICCHTILFNTNTIDLIPYAVPFFPMTYTFHNWKPIFSNPPSPTLPIPLPLSPLMITSLFSVVIDLFLLFLFVHLFFEFYIQVKSYGLCPSGIVFDKCLINSKLF